MFTMAHPAIESLLKHEYDLQCTVKVKHICKLTEVFYDMVHKNVFVYF